MLNTQFESQRIVILGGTSGIGLATAERAAADGATVIVASSSPDRIDAALERLPASAEGYTVNVRHLDDRKACQAAAAAIRAGSCSSTLLRTAPGEVPMMRLKARLKAASER